MEEGRVTCETLPFIKAHLKILLEGLDYVNSQSHIHTDKHRLPFSIVSHQHIYIWNSITSSYDSRIGLLSKSLYGRKLLIQWPVNIVMVEPYTAAMMVLVWYSKGLRR